MKIKLKKGVNYSVYKCKNVSGMSIHKVDDDKVTVHYNYTPKWDDTQEKFKIYLRDNGLTDDVIKVILDNIEVYGKSSTPPEIIEIGIASCRERVYVLV